MGSTPIRVLIIEDSEIYALLIQRWVEETKQPWQLTRATCLANACKHLVDAIFDLIILDLHLPDSNGLDSYHRLAGEAGATPIVILTGADEQATAIEAIKDGAQDYLVKTETTGRGLVRALQLAIERSALLRPDKPTVPPLHCQIVQQCLAALSPREQEVLQQLIQGKSVSQIAQSLGTKYHTVKNQRASIMRKLQVSSVVELTRKVLFDDQNSS